MISRLALYHRWRRIRVTSLVYQVATVALTIAAMVFVCWISLL